MGEVRGLGPRFWSLGRERKRDGPVGWRGWFIPFDLGGLGDDSGAIGREPDGIAGLEPAGTSRISVTDLQERFTQALDQPAAADLPDAGMADAHARILRQSDVASVVAAH